MVLHGARHGALLVSAWRLRPAAAQDALPLSVLATGVFLATYAPQGVNPALAAEVQQTLSEAAFAERLMDANVRLVLAEREGWLLGFADLALDGRGRVNGLAGSELRKLYVHPGVQGQGIGAALLGAGEALVREAGSAQCWLTAWEGNARALRYYPRQGFAEVGETDYLIDAQAYRNIVFAKALH